MRLKSIYISKYKNLKNFSLSFDGGSFIDIFVGKNGSGKSNLLEALIEIFQHIISFDSERSDLLFNYTINYKIGDTEVQIRWQEEVLSIDGKVRKTVGKTPVPENVLVYYSGHNDSVEKLVQQYESKFSRKIKAAATNDSRQIIGIGPKYKELLLAVLLIQFGECKARDFVKQKLGIRQLGLEIPGSQERTAPVIKLVLERPDYAKNKNEFDIVNNDETDRYWKPVGITKHFLEQLNSCIDTAPGGLTVTNGYLGSDERYVLYLDIAKVQTTFQGITPQELFRQFDNLKTLGMLTEISVPLSLEGSTNGAISYFSDGQFQSVYIYAITELFKDKHCITLLDEPDAFLHPEWQFEYLKQVVEISEQATKTNHILMTSHSASTIATAEASTINLFDFNNGKVVVNKVTKSEVIKSLSAGLISFSESEARLNIHHVLKNTTQPVLFTEGITDEMILETAWGKLYPEEERPFEIQNAFSCGFLRNLVKDNTLYQNHVGRTFFSLFDFDEAHNDWKQLGNDVEVDPHKCLTKKHQTQESYAMLLPVPTTDPIRNQVINPDTGSTYGNKSLLTIELLFYGIPGLEQYFKVDTSRTDNFIKFVSDAQKVTFAKEVVPTIDVIYFEIFKPIFEFIKSKCVVLADLSEEAVA
jgi:ABC-type phosphate/phosphonate transport system ATPase subunit